MQRAIKTILFIIAFFLFYSSASKVYAQEVPIISTPIQKMDTSVQIKNLEERIDKYRDENYQKAIQTAENASKKADNFINIVSIYATVVGVIIALFGFIGTFFAFRFGNNLSSMLKQLNSHVIRAKKSADNIKIKYNEANKKAKQLNSEMEELRKFRESNKKLLSSSTKTSKTQKTALENIDKKIQDISSRADKTLSQLESLRNSATYISASTSPSYQGDTGYSGGTRGAGGNVFNPYDFGANGGGVYNPYDFGANGGGVYNPYDENITVTGVADGTIPTTTTTSSSNISGRTTPTTTTTSSTKGTR